MKTHRSLLALTAANLVLLLVAIAQQLRRTFAQGEPAVLRGRALEIVDGQGRVRASISVLPPGRSANGDEYPANKSSGHSGAEAICERDA